MIGEVANWEHEEQIIQELLKDSILAKQDKEFQREYELRKNNFNKKAGLTQTNIMNKTGLKANRY